MQTHHEAVLSTQSGVLSATRDHAPWGGVCNPLSLLRNGRVPIHREGAPPTQSCVLLAPRYHTSKGGIYPTRSRMLAIDIGLLLTL